MNNILQIKNKIILGSRNICGVVLLLTLLSVAPMQVGAETINPAYLTQIINQKTVTLSIKDKSIVDILSEIQTQSGVEFGFAESAKPENMGLFSINVNKKTVKETLDLLFAKGEYIYSVLANKIIIEKKAAQSASKVASAVAKELKGRVIDSGEKKPIVGATLIVLNSNVGAISDDKGDFIIKAKPGDKMELSCVGFQTKIYTVTSYASNITITLEPEAIAVEDVVVTGIFKRKKEGFTGSAITVKNEDIVKLTSNNVLRALDMIDPGFRMGTNNIAGSNPNAIPDFEMRGQSNMGNYDGTDAVFLRGDLDTRPNQPLFVMDGIIGVSITKIIDMDPAQIESITILKDAAAMVIYGSRASNGVVVIETRAPEKGKLRVSYNGNYKVQTPDLSVYDLLNAKDKLELERKAGFYDERYTSGTASGILNFYTAKQLEVERGVDTYWLSKPVRTTFQHRHGLDLEGGDNTLRYKMYFGANFAPGVMKQTGINSKNGSIDIRYRTGKILISNQLYVDYTSGDRTSPYGSFRNYGTINSYYRAYDESGAIKRVLDDNKYFNGQDYVSVSTGTSDVMNPLYNTQFFQKDRSSSYELRDIFRLEYIPVDNLRFSADVNLSKISEDVDTFKPANHTDFTSGMAIEDKGIYNWRKNNTLNYAINFAVNYNNVFAQKHLVSVFLRYDIDDRYNHSAMAVMSGFPNDSMDEVFLGAKSRNSTGYESRSRSLGLVGTANYSYDQRYAFDVSARIDASSEFGRNNRYAPFWSGGARWNINKEKFLKDSKVVNELTLRASYGTTGSQGIASYLARQMYSYDGMMKIYHSSDVVGAILGSMGNPDLKWQQTKNSNVGVDFTLFNNMLSGRFEYYHKYTTNTVLDFSLAPSIGFDTVKDNLGNISNEGYEATIRIMPYNNVAKRLNFSIIANGGYNRNRIEKISEALKVKNEEAVSKVTDRPLPRYEEGFSQSIIWGIRSLGIDPITGREVFLKRNGEMTNEWDPIDQVPVGDTEPKLTGTVSANLNWGGLSVSLACKYLFGGQMYNYTLIEKVENANLRKNVDRRAFTERWSTPGEVTNFKGLTKEATGTSTKASSRFVMDNNEFAVSTINVQYRFEARTHEFIKKIGLSSASLGLYFEDLGRFSTIRMERGIDYPFARQVSMSLSLVF